MAREVFVKKEYYSRLKKEINELCQVEGMPEGVTYHKSRVTGQMKRQNKKKLFS